MHDFPTEIGDIQCNVADVSPRGCSDLNSLKRVRHDRKKPAMGGENAESPVAVTEGCPAFADGCPYGKNVEVAHWIKACDAGSSLAKR